MGRGVVLASEGVCSTHGYSGYYAVLCETRTGPARGEETRLFRAETEARKRKMEHRREPTTPPQAEKPSEKKGLDFHYKASKPFGAEQSKL